MKFKATLWNNSIEFGELKQVTIFVGKSRISIDELICELGQRYPRGQSYMFFGSRWHFSGITSNLSKMFEYVSASNTSFFAHINSLEVFQHLPNIIRKLKLEQDFQIIRIDNEKITHISFEEFEAMLEMGLEFR
jgi:hypothetical protein